MTHYLYLITDGEHTKIGISDNPQKRLKSLQSGNPRLLTLVETIEYDHERKAYLAEQALHGYWSDCRACGEWFSTPPSEILEGLAFCEIEARSIIAQEDKRQKIKTERRVDNISKLSARLKKLRVKD